MHRLFVYGTLRHPPLLAALVGRDVQVAPAVLAHHRAARLRGAQYPGLVPAPGAVAVGGLAMIEAGEVAVLDRFEGDQYTRTPVTVHSGDGGEELAAEVYLLTGESRSLVEADDWDFDAFVAGAATQWVRGARPGDQHPR